MFAGARAATLVLQLIGYRVAGTMALASIGMISCFTFLGGERSCFALSRYAIALILGIIVNSSPLSHIAVLSFRFLAAVASSLSSLGSFSSATRILFRCAYYFRHDFSFKLFPPTI